MKLLFFAASIASASLDLEQSSLLQSNLKKDTKDQIDIVPMVNMASKELSRLKSDATEEDVSEAMSGIIHKIKHASTSVLQLPQNEQAALMQRASQGSELNNLVGIFADLPKDLREKVAKAVVTSEELANTFEALPEDDQQAVLMQLGQNPFDGTTQSKNRPKTRTYKTVEDGVSTKVTETVNGDYFQQTKTNKYGTETTHRGKRGHTHSHKYKHNGYGGNAKTESASSKGSWLHSHSHEHNYDKETGRTRTKTETVSKGDGILDLTHSHEHIHRHVPGVGTTSYTGTETDSAIGNHKHQHEHYHNEITGDYDSDTNSKSTGPKWGEIFGNED